MRYGFIDALHLGEHHARRRCEEQTTEDIYELNSHHFVDVAGLDMAELDENLPQLQPALDMLGRFFKLPPADLSVANHHLTEAIFHER